MNSPFSARAENYWMVWDRFWFTPRLPHTMGILRLCTGVMLLYSHLVLASDLLSFLGPDAWISNQTSMQLHDGAFGYSDWARSYLWLIDAPAVLWAHHIVTMVITAMFAIGLLTRFTAPLALFFQWMLLHRLTGALFGLDQIVTYSTMYLAIAPSGATFSIDSWIRRKLDCGDKEYSRFVCWLFPDQLPRVSTNTATRLFQIHLCVIYLFGGLSKSRGTDWWDGNAMWYSFSNLEYQSIDMTWMSAYPLVMAAITHLTLFWETFYCALIWPKYTRPFVLATAVMIHGGIALFMGMITFGVMMIVANMVFVEPTWIARKRTEKDAEEDAAGSGGSNTPFLDVPLSDQPIAANAVVEREERLRRIARNLKAKKTRLKEREKKYRERVTRLKKREKKIKELIAKRRELKLRERQENE